VSLQEVRSFAMGADDLEAVTALEASLQSFPWSTGNFADSLAAGHDVRILRSDGELIGFSVVMKVVDEAHLLNIGIARPCQGQGHGARLLRQIIDAARAAGAVRLLLEVRPSNRQAIEFYQAFGFKQIGVRRGYYPAALGREDALVFDKELL
jgi:[ribosomal protein S18]-alanine N-acetyltransferase